MSRLTPVLSETDLPLAELCAARLDGEVFGVDECFCPVDQAAGAAHRGAALATAAPERLIAEQRSAAWVWGALDAPPAPHQFCSSTASRVRPAASKRLAVREVVIDEASVVSVGGMLVTTILRTIVDLARFSHRFGPREQSMVLRLIEAGGLDVAACVHDINSRRNLPNKRRAIERIGSAVARAVDVIDGVDAAHGIEHPVEVGGVAHLEHKLAQRKAVAGGRNGRRENIDVVLAQNPRHV